MSTTENTQPTTTVVAPATGEVLELEAAAPRELAQALEDVGDLLDRAFDFRQAVVNELARRADARGARTVTVGGVKYEVNAPTEDVYDLGVLRDAFNELLEAGVVDRELVDELIVQPPPKAQPERVAKARVNALLKSDDRRIINAIASARRRLPTKRTAKVLEVALEGTATEVAR